MIGSSSSLLGAGSFATGRRLRNRDLPVRNQWLRMGCGSQIRPRANVYTDFPKLVAEQPFEPFRCIALLLSFWSGIRLEFGANHGA